MRADPYDCGAFFWLPACKPFRLHGINTPVGTRPSAYTHVTLARLWRRSYARSHVHSVQVKNKVSTVRHYMRVRVDVILKAGPTTKKKKRSVNISRLGTGKEADRLSKDFHYKMMSNLSDPDDHRHSFEDLRLEIIDVMKFTLGQVLGQPNTDDNEALDE